MKFLALTLFGLLAVALVEGRAVRDAKSELIAKGQNLIKDAEDAVAKLTGAQKVQEAAIVKVEETRIKQLIAELQAASAPAVITRLEGELNQAEQKLAFEIQKANKEAPKPPAKRDLKSDLITKGNDLIKKADDGVAKLTGAQKMAEAAIVRAEDAVIKRLIAELQALPETADPATLRRVERELQSAEARLEAEIAKIEKLETNPTGPVVGPANPQKEALISKGEALVKQADEALAKLTGPQKTVEGALVKAEEIAINNLVKELQAATEPAAILRLEGELNRAEARLAAEIQKIQRLETVPNPPVVPVPDVPAF